MSETTMMTYKELATLLNVKVESAKTLRRRHNWRIVPPNKGREFLVEVPLSYLEEERKTTDTSPDSTSDTSPTVAPYNTSAPISPELLQMVADQSRQIGELQTRLSIAESRAGEADALQDRMVTLEADNRVLSVSLDAARKEAETEAQRRQQAESDLAAYKARGFLQRLFG